MPDGKNPLHWKRYRTPAVRKGREPEGDSDRYGGRARLGTPEREHFIVTYETTWRKQDEQEKKKGTD